MTFENLLTDDLVEEIKNALLSGNPFSYTKDGLTINANTSDNNLKFECIYKPTEDNSKKIRTDFYKFCDTVNQDLFVETCESFPSLKEVNDLIESNDEQQVQNGIEIFMNALRNKAIEKVAFLNKEIESTKQTLENLRETRNSILKCIE